MDLFKKPRFNRQEFHTILLRVLTYETTRGVEYRMISEELRSTLAKHDQQHLLKYYDAGLLTEEQKASLECQVQSILFF